MDSPRRLQSTVNAHGILGASVMRRMIGRAQVQQHAGKGTLGLSVLGLFLLTLVLAGCVSGDATLGSFEREFANDPAVVSVDLSSADNMPFTGGVGGTVVLDDGLDDEQVREFVHRIVDFRAQTDGDREESRVRIDLVMDGWKLPVLATDDANTALLDVVFALVRDPRVLSGTIISSDFGSDIDHVSLVTATIADFLTLITDAPTAFAETGRNPPITLHSPEGAEVAVEVSGVMRGWAQEAFGAFEVLQDQIPVTSFSAEEPEITITLANEGDVEAARMVVEQHLDPAQVEVFYQSELVTLAPGAHGDRAREVLARIDADLQAGLVAVWTDDRSMTVRADTVASAQRITEPLAKVLGAAEFPVTIKVVRGGGGEEVFSLEASPVDLVSHMQTALSLAHRDNVASLHVKPRFSLELEFDSPPTDDELSTSAAALRVLSEFDERLCITSPTDSFCTRTAPRIDFEHSDAPSARVFANAWNAAT